MGGVWFDLLDDQLPPILWREQFPEALSRSLITADNPKGTVSISDFELAGVLAHQDLLCAKRDVRERTIWIASNNRAAVSWATKGSSTSMTARAHLLLLNALHQRGYRYVAHHHYIPGPMNVVADDASCLWHLDDSTNFFTHFNSIYPQTKSWQLRTLSREVNASLTGALFKKRATLASLLNDTRPSKPRGGCGRPSVPAWEWSMPTAPLASTPSPFSSFSLINTAWAPLHPDVTPSALARWRKPYERWATRHMPDWGPLTLG